MDDSLKYYDQTFFKKRGSWRSEFNAIAKWIDKNVSGQTFGDIGCGNAHIIAYLHKQGKRVWGVDAAKNFEQYVDKEVRGFVKPADLTKHHKFNQCDVAMCVEVAERLDKKYADTAVKNIVDTQADVILFTAAGPGEAGIRHVNLQPKKYWLDKFRNHSYFLDTGLTEKFKDDLADQIKNPVWLLSDIMILRKFDNPKNGDAYIESGKYIKYLKQQIVDLTKENTKLTEELWHVSQRLNSILNSARWKASSKLIRLIKR